jgi:predicted ferric reductase
MAFAILIIQFIIAARVKWIERPVGFDILIRFHQYMAIFALALLIAHPLLLAAGGKGVRLLIGLDLPWYIWLGKITLILLLLNVILSKFQTSIGLPFEKWRLGHIILAPLIIGLAFTHSWTAGDDLELMILKALWLIALTLALLFFIYHKAVRPMLLRRRPFTVTEVTAETDDVWTIKMAPPAGGQLPDYLPGQFHFITFYRGRGLPVEEHHWTISSTPTEKRYLSSTIKALGDFTSTMGETRVGDTAAIHGSFGRFTHVLHPEEKELVFIAGGIGITPLMSMLRYMRDTGDDRKVLLLYANDREETIVFRKELAEIEALDRPSLKVIHVLSRADKGWQGQTGRIDGEKLDRFCGRNIDAKTFYLCGPAPMLTALIDALKERGVPDKRIRAEIFSFLD